MKREVILGVAALTLLTPLAIAQEQAPRTALTWSNADDPGVVLVRNATIWTQDEAGILQGADMLVRDGRIVEIGSGLAVPAGAMVIDATGMHVTPGLIDAHSHAGSDGTNEGSEIVTAEVSIEDVLNPDDRNIYQQLAGGTTAAQVLHGSANAIGGRSALVKWRYRAPRGHDLLIDGATPTIKFALGENPKRSAFSLPIPGLPTRYPATRMGVANAIRTAFLQARDYQAAWDAYNALSEAQQQHTAPPRRDFRLETLVQILDGERMVQSHSYRQDEIIMLIRVAEEMGFQIAAFQHVLEGYKASHEIAAHGAGASTFSDWWGYKFEVVDAIPYNGAIMHDDGVVVSFNSDSGELARRLNTEAAKAVKYGGLSEQDALAFVTSNPARQLLLFDRIGSLRAGKDADFVIWNGHPLSVYSRVETTFVDGRRVFDRGLDRQLHEAVAAEKARIVALIEGDSDTSEDAAEGDDDAAAEDATDAGTAENETADEPAATPAAALAGPGPRSYTTNPLGQRGTTAIVGATVHTVSGATIANGVVVFADGVITAVGGPDTAIPAGAERIDAAGKHLYPGMIAADSVIGLTEVDSVPGSVDTAEIDEFNSDLRVEVAVNAASELIPVTRANGITHVLTVPRGGIIAGASALLRLDGWTWEEMTALSRAGMHLMFPGGGGGFFFGPPPSDEEVEKQRKEALEKIDALLDGARAWGIAKAAEAGGGRHVDSDPKLEGLQPVLRGEVPLFLHTRGARAIKAALEWAATHEGLRVAIVDSGDTWRAADALAAAGVPVIVSSTYAVPAFADDPYDAMYANPAHLQAAGVTFAIADGAAGPGSDDRNLPYQAGMAAAFGLTPEQALRAVTLSAAEILGVGDALGSIDVGKSASLVLTDGDLLEVRTNVLGEWIDGSAIDLQSKHTRLWEKWRDRPQPGNR